jgi:hypothetical protein
MRPVSPLKRNAPSTINALFVLVSDNALANPYTPKGRMMPQEAIADHNGKSNEDLDMSKKPPWRK